MHNNNIKKTLLLSALFVAGSFLWSGGGKALASSQHSSSGQQGHVNPFFKVPDVFLSKQRTDQQAQTATQQQQPITQQHQEQLALRNVIQELFEDDRVQEALHVTPATSVTNQHLQAARQLMNVGLEFNVDNLAANPQFFIAAMRLVTLGFDTVTKDQLFAIFKLMRGARRRPQLTYHEITKNDVKAMVLLMTNSEGRFFSDGNDVDSLTNSLNMGNAAGTQDQPSKLALDVAKYLLDKGFTQFGTDEMTAYYYLAKRESIRATPLQQPTVEQIRAVADLNQKINNSIIEDDRVAYKAKAAVVQRIRINNGHIPNALAMLKRYGYNYQDPKKPGKDAILEMLWIKPGLNLRDDKGHFLQAGQRFVIRHDNRDLDASLPFDQAVGAFVTFDKVINRGGANADRLLALKLQDVLQ
jgi:hypothetical protein